MLRAARTPGRVLSTVFCKTIHSKREPDPRTLVQKRTFLSSHKNINTPSAKARMWRNASKVHFCWWRPSEQPSAKLSKCSEQFHRHQFRDIIDIYLRGFWTFKRSGFLVKRIKLQAQGQLLMRLQTWRYRCTIWIDRGKARQMVWTWRKQAVYSGGTGFSKPKPSICSAVKWHLHAEAPSVYLAERQKRCLIHWLIHYFISIILLA